MARQILGGPKGDARAVAADRGTNVGETWETGLGVGDLRETAARYVVEVYLAVAIGVAAGQVSGRHKSDARAIAVD